MARVRLDDVLTLCRESVAVDERKTYPNLGLYSFGRGAFVKDPIDGATTSADKLFRVAAGQFIYSRLFAFEGAFSLVPEAMDGWFVSNEYPTFDVDLERTTPRFLEIAICRPAVWQELASQTIGMGHRRQRLHPDAFLAYEFELPSLDRQREIVDAVDRADALCCALAAELDATASLHKSLRERLISRAVAEALPLRDVLVAIEGGKSPKCANRQPREDEWGVLKVSAIRPGEFRPAEAKPVADVSSFPNHAIVRRGDILTTRASGSLALVGSVCMVEEDPGRRVLCDKTLRLRFDEERVHGEYVVEAMSTMEARTQIQLAADGSSGQKNVSHGDIKDIEIPLPALSEQVSIASQLGRCRRLVADVRRELHTAKSVRASLVDQLLTVRVDETIASAAR